MRLLSLKSSEMRRVGTCAAMSKLRLNGSGAFTIDSDPVRPAAEYSACVRVRVRVRGRQKMWETDEGGHMRERGD